MNPFQLVKVESPSAAVTAFEQNDRAQYVAGGTNILDLMKIGVEEPLVLVDINGLQLSAVERRGDAVFIGALARLSDVALNPGVRADLPLVAIALQQSAVPQLRNKATVGGNLLQRTRCPYFRDIATPCNKRVPNSGCGALEGENRREAVLGTSPQCIATHPSDLAVALAAIDATIHVVGAHGNREIAIHDFYRLPGDTPQIENALQPGELIVGVSVPLLPFARRSTYVKVRDRGQYNFALASAAVALNLDGNTITESRVALGGVGTVPWRSPEAERALANAPATRESFQRTAAAALSGARGYGQNDFKISLAQHTLVRALEEVAV